MHACMPTCTPLCAYGLYIIDIYDDIAFFSLGHNLEIVVVEQESC